MKFNAILPSFLKGHFLFIAGEERIIQLMLTKGDIYPKINFKHVSWHIKDLERLCMHINVLLLLQFERLIWKTCPHPNNWGFFICKGSSIVCLLIQSQTDGSESSLLFFLALYFSPIWPHSLYITDFLVSCVVLAEWITFEIQDSSLKECSIIYKDAIKR